MSTSSGRSDRVGAAGVAAEEGEHASLAAEETIWLFGAPVRAEGPRGARARAKRDGTS
jgi:chromosome condensin MukBEF MukE localization factor